MDIFERALAFARRAHDGQKRKYTGIPFIVHPIEVASILAMFGQPDNVVVAGLLHDTIEDCGVTADDLSKNFGKQVAQLVLEVTDISRPQDGNRAARKKIDRDHLSSASIGGQNIKCADLISNTRTIVDFDRSFAPVYLVEKREILEVLTKASGTLHSAAWATLVHAERALAEHNHAASLQGAKHNP